MNNEIAEPFFPKDEYDTRYKRARECMAKRNLNTLLATSLPSYAYFGGHRIPNMIPNRSRPFIVVVPRDAPPCLVIQVPFAAAAERTSWVKDVHTWSGLPFRVDSLADCLTRLGLSDSRIGCELGLEDKLGISYNDFTRLKQLLPKATFEDASDIFSDLRMIKSERETAKLRQACKTTGEAYSEFFRNAKIGMTEDEIYRMLYRSMISAGADNPSFISVKLYPGGISTCPPTSRRAKAGDVVWIDMGATFENYQCDFSRNGVFGEPSKEQKQAHQLVVDVTQECVKMVAPGVAVSKVATQCSKELKLRGIPEKAMGRIGHGIGLDYLELPSVSPTDPTILKEGMTITIEPGLLDKTAYYVIEQNLAVTSSGHERLSTFPDDLQVIK